MRLALIYILLFLLPAGYANKLPANLPGHNTVSSRNGITKGTYFSGEHVLIASIGLPEEEQYREAEDLEDEEPSESSPKKYKTITGASPIPALQPGVCPPSFFSQELPNFWHHSQYRYILHRRLII